MKLRADRVSSNNQVDTLGTFASGACVIHCALASFLPGLFAGLGLESLIGHQTEWFLTVVAIVCALSATFLGWQQHRSPQIAALFAAGIVGLLAAWFLEVMGEHGAHGDEVKHAEKDEHDEKGGGKEIEGHGEHHELGLGIVVGLGSGALLVFSHFKNAASIRLSEEDCCQIPR